MKRRNLLKIRYYFIKFIPLWLLLAAPFILFPSPFRALVLLLFPLIWILQKYEKGHFISRTPLDWPIFLLLLMVLISLYATFDIQFSLPKITGILFHIVVFYAVIETTQTRKGLNNTLSLYLLFGMIVVIMGLLGTHWPTSSKVPIVSSIANIANQLPTLINGLPGAESGIDGNQLAGTLLWVFPLQLGLLWGSIVTPDADSLFFKVRYLLWIVFGITLLVFFLTLSRGGWIGGIAALAFFFSVLNKYIRRLTLAGLVVVVLIGFGLGWSALFELFVSDTAQELVGGLNSVEFRLEVWRTALWGIADFPFTGMGLGTFRQVVRFLYPLNISPAYDIAHAHNQFLQTALDLGIPGLIAYVAIWIGMGYILFQVIRRTRDQFIKLTATGIAAGLVGYFVYGLTDTVALGAKPGFLFWWLLALGMGVYAQ